MSTVAATGHNTSTNSSNALPHPSQWTIRFQQLMELDQHCEQQFGTEEYATMTMRDICDRVIEPCCRQYRTSYALHLNHGLRDTSSQSKASDASGEYAFISHCWDEPFNAFCESIRQVFQTAITKPKLWICALAIRQGDPDFISCQLETTTPNASLMDTPFVQALQKASSFVVVRNATTDLYSRIWCVCELMYAKELGLVPHLTHVTGPNVFSDLSTSVLDAKATKLRDRERILKVLLTQHERQEIDDLVQKFRMHDTPVAVPAATVVTPTPATPQLQASITPPQSQVPANPIFASIWGEMDADLQDAFALAGAAARRQGKNYISTTQLFSALRRLSPHKSLADFFEQLPEGALPESTPQAIPIQVEALNGIESLSPCVNAAMAHLSPSLPSSDGDPSSSSTSPGALGTTTTTTDNLINTGIKISSKDVFVDIAIHGKSKSTVRLRTHGVDESTVEGIVEQLGWRVLKRRRIG